MRDVGHHTSERVVTSTMNGESASRSARSFSDFAITVAHQVTRLHSQRISNSLASGYRTVVGIVRATDHSLPVDSHGERLDLRAVHVRLDQPDGTGHGCLALLSESRLNDHRPSRTLNSSF